ncbi:hypothetical protein ACIQUO_11425 [Streptomyces albogriseolus]|uniref:hypothetical protein n=1 Tax=Streptomyces albogriseolus TaxID=1887 RepID=UPI001677081D|nr:hypothetical protein [Streptomyces viridodiastaticus]MCX4566566.1 hypothetical protein [Streptomyces viridodiastaticus]GHG08082.1 hypothetical protein GCM10018777_20430 [Streptomyces viridodiastaticus]
MTYLAVFEGKAGQAVHRDDLTRALRTHWPDARISVTSPDAPGREVRDVTWLYEEAGDRLEGRSHADGTCLYLEGPLHLAVRFACWYRRLVPATEELILCDDTYGFAVPVTVGATPESVERAVTTGE